VRRVYKTDSLQGLEREGGGRIMAECMVLLCHEFASLKVPSHQIRLG
jgi:hypothetical protein